VTNYHMNSSADKSRISYSNHISLATLLKRKKTSWPPSQQSTVMCYKGSGTK